MKQLFLACFIVLSLNSFSNPEKLIGNRTNGIVVYSSSKHNDSLYVFYGMSLHEGGYAFTLKTTDIDNCYEIIGALPNQTNYVSFGNIGDKVFLKHINGENVLIARNSHGLIKELLIPIENLEDHRKFREKNKANFELAGRYINTSDGNEVIFYSNSKLAKGLNETSGFEFMSELSIPINVIVFSDSQTYYYEKTPFGLTIFNAEHDGHFFWDKTDKLFALEKVEWFNPFADKGYKGRYPYASTDILIDDILLWFSSEELRLMRNEIFARHGHIFKSEDLRLHFESQNWYKPLFSNVNNKLSEIEKLNIELIQRAEKTKE